MANKKATVLDALVVVMAGLTGVKTATLDLLPPDRSRVNAPYIGVLAHDEVKIVEDSTHIRYLLPVDLILIKAGDVIEEFVDLVKNAIYAPISIGAASVDLIESGPTNLVLADDFSSVRLVLEVQYVATKGAF